MVCSMNELTHATKLLYDLLVRNTMLMFYFILGKSILRYLLKELLVFLTIVQIYFEIF